MKVKRLLLLLALPPLVASRTSYKNVPYLQSPEAVNDFGETPPLYSAKIMPKDLLSIMISTTGPKAATLLNLTIQTPISAALTNISTTAQPTMQRYLVNNKGEIGFPVTDRLEVGGLTENKAEDLIRERLKPYLKKSPIVTIRMANYKISVLNEMTRPGSFTIGNEEMNVLEALAMAGDMTIYGVHDNIKLIREGMNDEREVINLNLNNAGVVTSPYYYLKRNDIIYVTPNKTRTKSSDIGNSTAFWISSLSILVSIVGLLVNILK